MPPHHRIGEKKRYHYGGGPSGRYGSFSSGQEGSGSGSSGSRHSRYDPNATVRGPHSSRPSSRFNPNVSVTDTKRGSIDGNASNANGSRNGPSNSSHGNGVTNANTSAGVSPSASNSASISPSTSHNHNTITNPVNASSTSNNTNSNSNHHVNSNVPASASSSSRWAGSHSRYNPQAGVSVTNNTPALSTSSAQGGPATAPSASTSGSPYYPSNTLNGSSKYSYVSGRSQRPRSSFDTFPPNASADLYDNSTKHAFSGTKTAMSGSSASISGGNNLNNSLGSNSRNSYWGNRGSRSGGKYHSGSRYNGFRKYPFDYGFHDMPDIPKSKKSFDTSSHPSKSSLINSVPQTTRKVEEQVSHNHKRIDISAEEYTGDSDTRSYSSFQEKTDGQDEGSELDDEAQMYDMNNGTPTTDRKQESFSLLENKDNTAKNTAQKEEGRESRQQSPHTVMNDDSNVMLDVSDNTKKSDKIDEEYDDEPKKTSVVDNDVPTSINNNDEKEDSHVTEKDDFDEEDAEKLHENSLQNLTGPLAEKQHIPPQDYISKAEPYPTPIHPIEECIFPMQEPQMKLWMLKNKPRADRIKNQKYLLKKPVQYLFDYPFFTKAWIIHEQAVKPVVIKNLSEIKRYEYLRKLQLKDQFFKLENEWTKKCERMSKLSETLHRTDSEEDHKKHTNDNKVQENTNGETDRRPTSSRRRNRADFVDDNDIENVLLQIDPDYKHHQLAATIPPMIINPVEKFACLFKDVNNLVTDKDKWASRVLSDGIDTFTPYEHELFIEGYLSYPKKFGKISHYMGNLRTPEECVLHYYRTKKTSKYKKLLLEKHKKRKASIGRRKKEKDKTEAKRKEDDEKETKKSETVPSETATSTVEKNLSAEETEKAPALAPKIESPPSVKPIEEVPPSQPVPVAASVSVNENSTLNTNVTEAETETEVKKESDTESENEVTTDGDSVLKQQLVDAGESLRETATPQTVIHQQSLPHHNEVIEEESQVVENVTANVVGQDNDSEKAITSSNNLDKAGSHPKVDGDSEGVLKHPLSEQQLANHTEQPMKKKIKQSDINHKSSYWSVQESKMFPELVKEFGSNWTAISQKLGTKSTTMVKNYFQRKAGQNGWYALVEMGNNNHNHNQSNLGLSTTATSDQVNKPVAIAPAPSNVGNIATSAPSTGSGQGLINMPRSSNLPFGTANNERSNMGLNELPSVTQQQQQQQPQQQPQQPPVGYFSDNGLPAIHSPAFTLTRNEDSFSNFPTPTQGLPVQHMPEISSFNTHNILPKLNAGNIHSEPQMQLPVQNKNVATGSDSTMNKPQGASVHFPHNIVGNTGNSVTQSYTVAPSRRSSIRSLLNDGEDSKPTRSATPPNITPTVSSTTLPALRPMSTTSAMPLQSIAPSRSTEPVASKVIVQELSHTKAYTNANLNHNTVPQNIAPIQNTQLLPVPSVSSINFANDPLAALAAVASSTEAFGLVPAAPPNNQHQHHQSIKQNNTDGNGHIH